ncbi:MAG: hypothetical protein JNN05_03735 [Candidatus Omnitrophica bacterium]|nr:hypothetical protein [Candidatus Omnitrophota bacterium]
MFKKRLTACVLVQNGWVVQSIGFKRYLPIGTLDVTIEFLNKWGIDEIIILDIDATVQGRQPDFERIKRISKKNFAPLAVGGGIRDVEDMRHLVHSGADKIVVNTVALDCPKIITSGADIFGAQCIVVSMDVRRHPDVRYDVYRY